jgi:hypothetical protein
LKYKSLFDFLQFKFKNDWHCSDTYRKVKDKKKTHHKYVFFQLTLEYYYRHVIPPPFGILAQIIFIFERATSDNPFRELTAFLQASSPVIRDYCIDLHLQQCT